ncbi:gluconokinase [Shimia sp. R11_0]|uniref:gluconokinase n=1 Tax=Shimia sp. R11_0 TaxID=2821096 RepID=UPI001AD9CBA9|nr:gluconokinase [Shimia sp. R11_0]MBO9476736.1 gluconokinase [Shimia sp. R11_0]
MAATFKGQTFIVMGVSGVGKSTLAQALAQALKAQYLEADDLHPKSNIDRMAQGLPLTDEMRIPWLQALRSAISEHHHHHPDKDLVATCSALKRQYRDLLKTNNPQTTFLHLTAPKDVILHRISKRQDHFMPASLLSSQFAALEPLTKDEDHLLIDGTLPPDTIIERVLSQLPTSAHIT